MAADAQKNTRKNSRKAKRLRRELEERKTIKKSINMIDTLIAVVAQICACGFVCNGDCVSRSAKYKKSTQAHFEPLGGNYAIC